MRFVSTEIDGTAFGTDEVLYFHGYNVPHTAAEILAAGGGTDKLPAKSIWWQGREYKARHVKSKGSSHPPRAATRSQRCG